MDGKYAINQVPERYCSSLQNLGGNVYFEQSTQRVFRKDGDTYRKIEMNDED